MVRHLHHPSRVLAGMTAAALAIAMTWPAAPQDPPADAPPAPNVVLTLAPATQTIKSGQQPRLTATLVNRGNQAVTLVAPGDGSESGWRTPLIEWSPRPAGKVARCGNINALRSKEVFTLKPGESRVLSEWIGQPHLAGAGRHKVSLRYVNEPGRKWNGLPLGEHDPEAMKAVKGSTPVTVVSNMVEVVVEP